MATDTDLPQLYLINKPSFKYRLYLKELKFEGFQNGNVDSTTKFDFSYNHGNNLPIRFSTGQDWFGYFNGQTSNVSLLPDISSQFPDLYVKIGQTFMGNRNPDTTKWLMGSYVK